jgi:hypothetical protein
MSIYKLVEMALLAPRQDRFDCSGSPRSLVYFGISTHKRILCRLVDSTTDGHTGPIT